MGEIIQFKDFHKKISPLEKEVPSAPIETEREKINPFSPDNFDNLRGKIFKIRNLSIPSEEGFQKKLAIMKEYTNEYLFNCLNDSSVDNWKRKPEFFKAIAEEFSSRFEKYSAENKEDKSSI